MSFTPHQIRRALPSGLWSDGYRAELFDRSHLGPEEHHWIYSRNEAKVLLHEMAQAQLDADMGKHPPNAFFGYTDIQSDLDTVFYECCLTDFGRRARKAAERELCCDDRGELDVEATLDYWFWKVSRVSPTQACYTVHPWLRDYADWLALDWAVPIRTAIYHVLSLRNVDTQGQPDDERTVAFWINDDTALHPVYRDRLLALDDEWARPIQEWIVLQRLSR